MTKRNKLSFQILLLAVAILATLSCEKEVNSEQSQHKTFIRVLGDQYTDYGTFIAETGNGEILVAGAGGVGAEMAGYRFDAYGSPLGMDPLEGDGGITHGTRLRGGGFILSNFLSSHIVRVSEEGAVLADNWFDPNLDGRYRFSRVIEEEAGNHLYISYTNGPTNGAPSGTYISELNYDGVELKYFTITDAMLGGKVLHLEVVRAKGNLLWLSGSFFNKIPFSWADAAKSFVAIFDMNTQQLTKTLKYDINDDSESDWLISCFATEDGAIINLVAGAYFAWDGTGLVCPEFEVFRTSEDGEPEWRKRVDIGVLGVYPMEIKPLSDGGFLVTGYCYGKEFKAGRPFMVRLNQHGDVIMQKIIQYLGPAEFIYCEETRDHRFLFTGMSYTYGSGKEDVNTIVVATDAFGNVE